MLLFYLKGHDLNFHNDFVGCWYRSYFIPVKDTKHEKT